MWPNGNGLVYGLARSQNWSIVLKTKKIFKEKKDSIYAKYVKVADLTTLHLGQIDY